MSSLDAGSVRRILSDPERAQADGDLVVLTDDRPVPEGTSVFRATEPGHLGALVAALFGNHQSGIRLASVPWDLDGLPDAARQEIVDAVGAVVQQWGNSVIDGAHGLRNLIRNAPVLLPAPRITSPITTVPAIAVGAGPSTAALLDDIRRAAAAGCLIVACDAALGPLLAAGIAVDACTPLERLNSTAEKLAGIRAPGVAYAGSPFAPPEALGSFGWFTLWPTCDPIFDWYECPEDRFNPGPTTGTAAVAVALALTGGPVYLVGHDLCGGHMTGAEVSAAHADDFDAQRRAYDGTLRPTKTAWLRAKYDLEGFGMTGRLVNAAGHAGHGLVLDGIRCAPIAPFAGPPVAWPTERDEGRLARFQAKAVHLGADLRAAAAAAQRATTIAGMDLASLSDPRSFDAIAYLLRPLYAQCSLERRLGREERWVLACFQEGIANIADTVAEAIHA